MCNKCMCLTSNSYFSSCNSCSAEQTIPSGKLGLQWQLCGFLALTAPRSTMLIMLSGYKPASPADLRTCRMQGGLLVTSRTEQCALSLGTGLGLNRNGSDPAAHQVVLPSHPGFAAAPA